MKSNKTIVNDINKMFPPANKKHPTCFIRDNLAIVSGECDVVEVIQGERFECTIIDYYGDFRNGYPWIHPKLEKYAEKLDMYWEWENPGCICLAS